MKVIEAVWEKRNLGVSCVEIEIARNDRAEDVMEAIQAREEQYQVVKLPSGRVDLLFPLQDIGFKYIESAIATGMPLSKKPVMPERYASIASRIIGHVATADEVGDLLAMIERGEIFTTDRIALDPAFGREVAGRRYANWTRDLLAAGATLVVSEYDGQRFGFSVDQLSENGKEWHSILGGNFPDNHGEGLAAVGMCKTILKAYSCGSRRFVSAVSSNNLPILKIHLECGLKIKSISDVLIRHR